MKRDARLRELSSDHHLALVLARKAERSAESGSDTDVHAMWSEVRQAFNAQLDPHFTIEETYILPALETAGYNDAVKRTQGEHTLIRGFVNSPDLTRDGLESFASLLKLHVRFEEHELFPLAEQALSDEMLEKIAAVSRTPQESKAQL